MYPSKILGRTLTLLLALATGLAAAALAYILLRRPLLRPMQRPVTVRIVVASRDIPARSEVTANMLRFQAMPSVQAPADALSDFSQAAGKVTLIPIASGQPVMPSAVAAPSAELGLAYALRPAYRAVTVALDPVTGVAGFLKPGDHVDVLTTCDVGDGQSVTRTVLQNVALLAIGSKMVATGDNDPSSMGGQPQVPNATLAVSPGNAQKLVMAANRGKLQLTLRSPDDVAQPELPTLHSSVVTGTVPKGLPPASPLPPVKPVRIATQPKAPAPRTRPLAPPPLPQIMVIRGTAATTVSVSQ